MTKRTSRETTNVEYLHFSFSGRMPEEILILPKSRFISFLPHIKSVGESQIINAYAIPQSGEAALTATFFVAYRKTGCPEFRGTMQRTVCSGPSQRLKGRPCILTAEGMGLASMSPWWRMQCRGASSCEIPPPPRSDVQQKMDEMRRVGWMEGGGGVAEGRARDMAMDAPRQMFWMSWGRAAVVLSQQLKKARARKETYHA